MKKAFLLLAMIFFLAGSMFAQLRNCGTMEYLKWQQQQDPTLAQRMQDIENATQAYIASNPGETRTVITIPVVVHVIYKTTAQNISDAQVQAQISQLNADYARLNADAGNTPSVFQSVAADCEIQFCLAQRDPNGNATNGIIHKSTTVTSFTSNNNVKHSSTGGDDAWPAASYLNLWSCNLGGGLLGYAQFPGGAASTDGVVVLYSSVGSLTQPGTAVPYQYGRTLTHEVGHWLNCYHIWGDDGTACTGSDLVADTPNQGSENYGCPTFPHVSCSNGPNGDMFMNYMDYTDDGCMNVFTAGQKSRMQALFATGGARVSITSSLGCQPPTSSCNAPSGLNASSITSSSATLGWNAVSGAVSYNIQYKISSGSTWATLTSTTNSKAISGLLASTSYDFQVQTVCSGGSSSYSAASSFTTLSSGGGGGCVETYEPNNTTGTAKAVSTEVDISSQISSSSDLDWYSFVNTSAKKNIKITLTNLPGDYDIKLYKSNGTNVATSQNGGTADETIIYNTTKVATYKIQVYGYAGAYSTTSCYTMHIYTSSSSFRTFEGTQQDLAATADLQLYPNPANSNMTLQYSSINKGDVQVNVYNLVGQRVYSNTEFALEGDNNFYLDVSRLTNGNYIAEVVSNGTSLHRQFVVAH